MKPSKYGMTDTFYPELFKYLDGSFIRIDSTDKYNRNPCVEIPLPMVEKETNRKLLLLL